ncbi:MAG: putative metalloprotease CJM1_0395 family protein, partial [Gammaproteobacteria bacterium]
MGAADPAEPRRLQELAARDNQVRTHERARLAAAGGLANGGARLQMTRGPDGRQYATGGEVSSDVAPVAGDPQATIDKAQKIRRAALAPWRRGPLQWRTKRASKCSARHVNPGRTMRPVGARIAAADTGRTTRLRV